MLICAQWLHMPWTEFQGLPAEERLRWHLFAELYYRKEQYAYDQAKRRGRSRRRTEE